MSSLCIDASQLYMLPMRFFDICAITLLHSNSLCAMLCHALLCYAAMCFIATCIAATSTMHMQLMCAILQCCFMGQVYRSALQVYNRGSAAMKVTLSLPSPLHPFLQAHPTTGFCQVCSVLSACQHVSQQDVLAKHAHRSMQQL